MKNGTKATAKKGTGKINRVTIRISGSGGQGIISTGMLLGEAIAIGDERNVSQSQSYGPEARGGATCADIIVSDGEIFFPECNLLDILVAFTYEAYEKYASLTREKGIIIADQSAVDVLSGTAETIKVPFIETAREKFSKSIVANMIALGFLSGYTGIVTGGSLLDVVNDHYAGSKHRDANIRAINEGFKLAREYAGSAKVFI